MAIIIKQNVEPIIPDNFNICFRNGWSPGNIENIPETIDEYSKIININLNNSRDLILSPISLRSFLSSSFDCGFFLKLAITLL